MSTLTLSVEPEQPMNWSMFPASQRIALRLDEGLMLWQTRNLPLRPAKVGPGPGQNFSRRACQGQAHIAINIPSFKLFLTRKDSFCLDCSKLWEVKVHVNQEITYEGKPGEEESKPHNRLGPFNPVHLLSVIWQHWRQIFCTSANILRTCWVSQFDD